MSVVACPKCAEKVTLPPKTPPAAKVRCPLCGENYLLEEAMSALPPMLEVLEQPEGYLPASDVDISTAAFLATPDRPATIDDDLGEFKLEAPEGGVAVADDDLAPTYDEWGPTRSTAAIHEPDTVATPQELIQTPLRRKNKQVNPLFHVIGIVMGGVLAIPAALMILLWLPGSWRRDIVPIGPWLGEHAPFLAPADFRKTYPDLPSEDTSAPANDKPPSVANKTRADGGLGGDSVLPGKSGLQGKQFDEELKKGFSLDAEDAKPQPKRSPAKGPPEEIRDTGVDDPVPEPTPEGDAELPPEAKPDPKPNDEGVPEATPAPEAKPAAEAGPEPAPEPAPNPDPGPQPDAESKVVEPEVKFELPERSQPQPAVDLLAAQRSALAAANEAFDEAATPADKKAAAIELYRTAAELAERLPSDSADSAGLDAIAGDAKKLQFVGVYASSWQENSERATPGIVLSGAVKGCQKAGERFETRVELPSRDKRELLVITAAECPVGQKLFIAGRFVMSARDMINGYNGDATMAIDARVLKVVE
jgi:hypothetical protein